MGRIVYAQPLEGEDPREASLLQFRLTYKGELLSSQRDPVGNQPVPLAGHKHAIRKAFHGQLKQLWETNKFLREAKLLANRNDGPHPGIHDQIADMGLASDKYEPMVEVLAHKFRRNGYRFVPLVCEQHSVLCSLDILFLRRDPPGALISAGDLDNRLKTLIDSLRMPKNGNELDSTKTPVGPGEDPFFCLLEDDKLVSGLSVETDTLLDGVTTKTDKDRCEVSLVITVNIKPYYATMFNLSFA